MEREHISTAFDIELNELRQSILVMGGKVELMIANSVKSLVDRDTPLAERTIALDHESQCCRGVDRRALSGAIGPAPAGRPRPALYHDRTQDRYRPGTHGRPVRQYRQADPRAESKSRRSNPTSTSPAWPTGPR